MSSLLAVLTVELVGKQVKVSTDMAFFITMNPGYAGCSNLPDNLKKLFRSLAMTKPDRQLIVEVMLFSQGFRSAEKLASRIVPFFKFLFEMKSLTYYFLMVLCRPFVFFSSFQRSTHPQEDPVV